MHTFISLSKIQKYVTSHFLILQEKQKNKKKHYKITSNSYTESFCIIDIKKHSFCSEKSMNWRYGDM